VRLLRFALPLLLCLLALAPLRANRPDPMGPGPPAPPPLPGGMAAPSAPFPRATDPPAAPHAAESPAAAPIADPVPADSAGLPLDLPVIAAIESLAPSPETGLATERLEPAPGWVAAETSVGSGPLAGGAGLGSAPGGAETTPPNLALGPSLGQAWAQSWGLTPMTPLGWRPAASAPLSAPLSTPLASPLAAGSLGRVAAASFGSEAPNPAAPDATSGAAPGAQPMAPPNALQDAPMGVTPGAALAQALAMGGALDAALGGGPMAAAAGGPAATDPAAEPGPLWTDPVALAALPAALFATPPEATDPDAASPADPLVPFLLLAAAPSLPDAADIPAPGPLGPLAVGLLGLAVLRRRRRVGAAAERGAAPLGLSPPKAEGPLGTGFWAAGFSVRAPPMRRGRDNTPWPKTALTSALSGRGPRRSSTGR
jgi:hypothetical protein